MSTSKTASLPVASVARVTRATRSPQRKRALLAVLFIVPLLVVNICVVAGPGMMSVYYSLTDWAGFGSAKFIGLSNYMQLFADSEFQSALLHNLIWTVIFLIVPMGMALLGAYLLSRLRRFATLFRALYFIPYIVSSVVSSTIWSSLLAGSGIGSVIGVNFLGNPATALPAVAVANVWTRWGFLVVIFFAAMQSVPPLLYEASSLDGASAMQQFFYVTLPSIRPTLMFMGLMSVIWSFLVFDWIYIMTGGGPAGSTEVLSTLLYREAFTSQRAGYASAIGVVLAIIAGVIVGVYQFVRARKGWGI